MPQDAPDGLLSALDGAAGAYRDRLASSGYTLEAFARIAVVEDREAYVVARTGPGMIPAEHRERIAEAAVSLANAIDRRVERLERKLARAERIAGELVKLARLEASPALVQAQIGRLAAVLELDAEAAA